MKVEVLGNDKKSYVFEEKFWTGKKELVVDGYATVPSGKGTFVTVNGEMLNLTGNVFTGRNLEWQNGTVIKLYRLKWFEVLLTLFPFTLLFFGILGGGFSTAVAITAALLSAFFNLSFLRTFDKMYKTLICCFLSFAVAFLIWFLLFGLSKSGLNHVFPILFRRWTK